MSLKDVQALIYHRQTPAQPFHSIHAILRSLSLAQSLLKDRNAPIWRQREPTFPRLPGYAIKKSANFWEKMDAPLPCLQGLSLTLGVSGFRFPNN